MNFNQLINDQILRKTFDFYDEDKNGYITYDELQKVFEPLQTEENLKEIIKEVTANNDNKISFDDLKHAVDLLKSSAFGYNSAWSIG